MYSSPFLGTMVYSASPGQQWGHQLLIWGMESLLLVCVVCLIVTVGLVIAHQMGRKKRRIAPFQSRDRLLSAQLYEEFSRSNSFSPDEVAAAWKTVTEALDIDPVLLRPSDRFATDFESFKVPMGESELTELEFTLTWAGKRAKLACSWEKIQTVGDAAQFLCACEQVAKGTDPLT